MWTRSCWQRLRRIPFSSCAGQGSYEGDALVDTQAMADALTDCGLPVHLEVWGSDVSHDWYWWGKELNLFAARVFG